MSEQDQRKASGPDDARENAGGSGSKPAGSRVPGWMLVIVLVAAPTLLYAAVLVVPFLPLSVGGKIWLASGLAVAAEVVFWGAAFFVGREVVSRYRRYLDPRRLFRRDGGQ